MGSNTVHFTVQRSQPSPLCRTCRVSGGVRVLPAHALLDGAMFIGYLRLSYVQHEDDADGTLKERVTVSQDDQCQHDDFVKVVRNEIARKVQYERHVQEKKNAEHATEGGGHNDEAVRYEFDIRVLRVEGCKAQCVSVVVAPTTQGSTQQWRRASTTNKQKKQKGCPDEAVQQVVNWLLDKHGPYEPGGLLEYRPEGLPKGVRRRMLYHVHHNPFTTVGDTGACYTGKKLRGGPGGATGGGGGVCVADHTVELSAEQPQQAVQQDSVANTRELQLRKEIAECLHANPDLGPDRTTSAKRTLKRCYHLLGFAEEVKLSRLLSDDATPRNNPVLLQPTRKLAKLVHDLDCELATQK